MTWFPNLPRLSEAPTTRTLFGEKKELNTLFTLEDKKRFTLFSDREDAPVNQITVFR